MPSGPRLGLARLFPSTCTCIGFRNTKRFTATVEDTHEVQELRQGGAHPHVQRSAHQSVIFPLNNLPIDLLLDVIEQLVLLYLDHPRRTCMQLPQILALRLVNRTWSKEVLVAFHQNVTYPNLPRSLLSRLIPSTSPCAPQRRATFASALYNSTLSLRNRHLGCALVKGILFCAAYAQTLPLPEGLTRKEIIQRLCNAASQNTKYASRSRRLAEGHTSFSTGQLSHDQPTCRLYFDSAELDHHVAVNSWQDYRSSDSMKLKSREGELVCTLIIMGMEDEAFQMVNRMASVPQSEIFGPLNCVARRWGRSRVLSRLERKNKGKSSCV